MEPIPTVISLGARTREGVLIRKTYVLARDRAAFIAWVRAERGGDLQACNFLSNIKNMRGVGFTDPTVELVALARWADRDDMAFMDAGFALCARYCLDRRVRNTPTK